LYVFATIRGELKIVNNVDDVLLISLAVTCDQQRSAVGPMIHIVLRPSNA